MIESFDQWLESREEEYLHAQTIAAQHHYWAMSIGMEPIDIENSTASAIAEYLEKLDDKIDQGVIPPGIQPIVFAARVKSVFHGAFDPKTDVYRDPNEIPPLA